MFGSPLVTGSMGELDDSGIVLFVVGSSGVALFMARSASPYVVLFMVFMAGSAGVIAVVGRSCGIPWPVMWVVKN